MERAKRPLRIAGLPCSLKSINNEPFACFPANLLTAHNSCGFVIPSDLLTSAMTLTTNRTKMYGQIQASLVIVSTPGQHRVMN